MKRVTLRRPKDTSAAAKGRKQASRDAQRKARDEFEMPDAQYSRGFYLRQVQKATDRIAPRITGESRRLETRGAQRKREKRITTAEDAETSVAEGVRERDAAVALSAAAVSSGLKPARRKGGKAGMQEALAGLAQGNKPLYRAIIRDSGGRGNDGTVRELASNRQAASRSAAEAREALREHVAADVPRTAAWKQERRELRNKVGQEKRAVRTVDRLIRALRSGRLQADDRVRAFADELGHINAGSERRQDEAGLFDDRSPESVAAKAGKPIGSLEANVKAGYAAAVLQPSGYKAPLQLETTTGAGRADVPDVPVKAGEAETTRRRTKRRFGGKAVAASVVAPDGGTVDLDGVPHPDRSGEAKARAATAPMGEGRIVDEIMRDGTPERDAQAAKITAERERLIALGTRIEQGPRKAAEKKIKDIEGALSDPTLSAKSRTSLDKALTAAKRGLAHIGEELDRLNNKQMDLEDAPGGRGGAVGYTEAKRIEATEARERGTSAPGPRGPAIEGFKTPEHRFLSSFHPVEIEYDGITYPSVEHFYQAMKTESKAGRLAISKLKMAADAKRAGKKLKVRDGWDDMKLKVMAHALEKKFAPDSPLAQQLLDTGDARLVEANNWGDQFWGMTGPESGQNHLGRLLMERRDKLRGDPPSKPELWEPPAPKPGGVVADVDDILLIGESRDLTRRLNEGTITPEERARLDVVDSQLFDVYWDNPDSLRQHIISMSRSPSSEEHPNPAYDRIVPALDDPRFVDGDAATRRKLATAIAKGEEANWRSQNRNRGYLQTFDPSVVRTSGETPTIVRARASEGDIVYVGRGIEGKGGGVRPFAGGDSSARGFWGNPYQAAGQTSNPSPWVVTVATTSEAVKRYKVLLDKNIAAGKVTPADLAALEGKQLGVPYAVPEDALTHASVIRDAVAANAARRQAEQGAPERTVVPEDTLGTDKVVADMDAALSDEDRARRAEAMGADDSSKGPKGPSFMSQVIPGAAQRGGRTEDVVPIYRDVLGDDVSPTDRGEPGVRRMLDWGEADDDGIAPAIARLERELGLTRDSADVELDAVAPAIARRERERAEALFPQDVMAIVTDIADGVREGFRRELAGGRQASKLTRPGSGRDTPGNISGYVTPGDPRSALRNSFTTDSKHARTGPHAVVASTEVQNEAWIRYTIARASEDPDTLAFLVSQDVDALHIKSGDAGRSHLEAARVVVHLAKLHHEYGHGLTFAEFAAGARTSLPASGRDMTKPRHVIITGMRDFNQDSVIEAAISELPMGTTVHHGAARGADRVAAEAARARGLKVVAHPVTSDTEGVDTVDAVWKEWKKAKATKKAEHKERARVEKVTGEPAGSLRLPRSPGSLRNESMIDAAHEAAAVDGQNVEMLAFHTLGARVRQPGDIGRGTRHAVSTMEKREGGRERTIAYGLNGPVDRRGQTKGNAIADAVEAELDLQRKAGQDRALDASRAEPQEGRRRRRLPPRNKHEAGQRAIDKKIADELDSDSPLDDPIAFLVDMEDEIKGAERDYDGADAIDETGFDDYDPSVMDDDDFGDNLPADFMDDEHDYGDDPAPPGQDVPRADADDFPSDEAFIDPANLTPRQRENFARDVQNMIGNAYEYGERASPGLQGKRIFTEEPGTPESAKEVDRFYYEVQTAGNQAILQHRPSSRGRGEGVATPPGIGTGTGLRSDNLIPGGLRGFLDTLRRHNRRINRQEFMVGVMQAVGYHRVNGRIVQGGDVRLMDSDDADALIAEHGVDGRKLVRLDYGTRRDKDKNDITQSYVVPSWVKQYIDMKYAEPGQLRTALRAFHAVFIHSVLPLSLGWQLLNPFDHMYRLVLTGGRDTFGYRNAGLSFTALTDAAKARSQDGGGGQLYETLGAGSGTHAGAVKRGGETIQSDTKGGIGQPVSAVLNAKRRLTFDKKPMGKLTDAGLDLAGKIDGWFAAPNRRAAFMEWSREMGIDHKRLQNDLRYQNALLDRLQAEPRLLRNLHDKQLEMIGNYARRTSFEARVTEWVPFYTWLRETTKFLLKTLPQRSPMRTVLMLHIISNTLSYRTSIGASDYFTEEEYREMGITKLTPRQMREIRIAGFNLPFAGATGLTTSTELIADVANFGAHQDLHAFTNVMPGVTRPVYRAFINPDDATLGSTDEGRQKQWYLLMKGFAAGQGGAALAILTGAYDPKGASGGLGITKEKVSYENDDKVVEEVTAEPWLRKDGKKAPKTTTLKRIGGALRAPGGPSIPSERPKVGTEAYFRANEAAKRKLGGMTPLEQRFGMQDGKSKAEVSRYAVAVDPASQTIKPWLNPLQPTYDPKGAKFQSKPDVRQEGGKSGASSNWPVKMLPLGNTPLPGAREGIATTYDPLQGGINGSEGSGAYAPAFSRGWGAARLGSAGGGVRNAWGLTVVRVTNKANGKSVLVPVIDNGPGGGNMNGKPRIIDLLPNVSRALNNGTADNLDVTVTPVGRISHADASKFGRGDLSGAGAVRSGNANAGPKGSPAQVVNTTVLKIARGVGIDITRESNDAANDRHSMLTTSGNKSEHKGPGNVAWAADMSDGTSPTPGMDKLAARLAKRFNIPWTGSGLVNHTEGGYRYQLIYRDTGHFNHVHFGVSLADPSAAGSDYVSSGGGGAGDYLATSGGAAASETTGDYSSQDVATTVDTGSTGGTPIMDALESGGIDALMAALKKKRRSR